MNDNGQQLVPTTAVCDLCCGAGYVYCQSIPDDDDYAKSQCRKDCPKCKASSE